MATLSSSTSSIHSDIRSDSRSYKRVKDHNTKWAMGTRPSAGVKQGFLWGEFRTGSKEQQAKVRPEKRYCDYHHCDHKTKGNDMSSWDGQDAHRARIARKEDALREVSSPTLSRSLADLLPSTSTSARTSSIDSGVLYSYDAPSTPRKVVGLNSLVEKAEMEWQSRETDKIVRDEYAVLDESGEIKVLTKGKGKKGSSPKQCAQVVERDEEDDDDWETI